MIMMPFWVLWEAAGFCKNASMTFLRRRSVLQVGEESLAALKGTFSFQRDFILEGNAAGYQSSLRVPRSQRLRGPHQDSQPHTWGLRYTHLTVPTYLSPYGSWQGMRKSLTKGGILWTVRSLLFNNKRKDSRKTGNNQFLRILALECLLFPKNAPSTLLFPVASNIADHAFFLELLHPLDLHDNHLLVFFSFVVDSFSVSFSRSFFCPWTLNVVVPWCPGAPFGAVFWCVQWFLVSYTTNVWATLKYLISSLGLFFPSELYTQTHSLSFFFL